MVCATSKGSDQPAHTRSLIRAFACRLNILWLLSYWPSIIWSSYMLKRRLHRLARVYTCKNATLLEITCHGSFIFGTEYRNVCQSTVPLHYITWTDSYKIYRISFMSAHVLLNLFNELGKIDKMRGLQSVLSLFRNEFNKFNNTRARMLDSIYHMTFRLLWNLISAIKTLFLSLCTQRCYGRHKVSRKSINH